MKIFILRHCETNNNIENSWSGCKTDIGLSPKGKQRNQELINELSQIKFDVIFSSPLLRCLETSKVLSEITNTKLVIDNRLIERDFGQLEGKKCNEDDKVKLCDLDLNTDLNQGVEKIQSLYQNRVIPFFDELLDKDYKNVLIVTHSWIVRLANYYLSDQKDKTVIYNKPKNGFYQIIDKTKIISRCFNHIEIKDNKLTKTSSYVDKFNDEIKWMISLPDKLSSYVPKVYSYNICLEKNEKNNSYITMEYINEKSFDQLYLNQELSNDMIKAFFNQIINFIKIASQYKIDINQEDIKKYLYDVYYKKTIDRWNDIKDDKKFANFYNNKIVINGIEYNSISYYLKNLENALYQYQVISEYRKFCIIHGDLCFNNILFKENKMYLIDPRGSFGKKWIYGDQLYELAKLAHSISGYDSIINNKYQLNYQDNNISYNFENNPNQETFLKMFENIVDKELLLKVYFIESLLFLSMIPLHSENYEHQIIFLALAVEKISKFIK